MNKKKKNSTAAEESVSAERETNRWWENYLVRYLMPSIAGVVIVSWLCTAEIGGNALRAILLLPLTSEPMNATSLTLLFLYGNLFCYVASYPVLVFHVTRVMDFSSETKESGVKWMWKKNLVVFDGYLAACVFAALAFGICFVPSNKWRFLGAFVLVLFLVGVQLYRLRRVLSPRLTFRKFFDSVSPAFAYAYSLARRRGQGLVPSSRREVWRAEFLETYRHMREHGNTAFIFLFELALAALVFCVIKKYEQSGVQQLSAIGVLFGIWTVPSVFVHLMGQHLERRFSCHDKKSGPGSKTSAPDDAQ